MPPHVSVRAEPIATGLARPVFATAPPEDTNRLFVVEQHTGRVRIIDLATRVVKQTPFLEIADLSRGNEQGLLGLAFHPRYDDNGQFFVNLTAPDGTTQVRRYTTSGDPDRANPAGAVTVLTIPQPFSNHNGGWLAFGPRDGFLYVALGDGGSADDPGNRAQQLGELLGKVLRIDVDHDDFANEPDRNYAIPADNPFLVQAGARPEIWAYGLRNPWRSSFDRQSGDLYLSDVGQGEREEINFQPAGSSGGTNYGWRLKEGTRVTDLGPLVPGLVDPIHEYTHDNGEQAVVGGYVYRGAAIPGLHGTYFFADFTGFMWSLRYDGQAVSELTSRETELFPDSSPRIASFGEDALGELYVITHGPGGLYRIVAGQ